MHPCTGHARGRGARATCTRGRIVHLVLVCRGTQFAYGHVVIELSVDNNPRTRCSLEWGQMAAQLTQPKPKAPKLKAGGGAKAAKAKTAGGAQRSPSPALGQQQPTTAEKSPGLHAAVAVVAALVAAVALGGLGSGGTPGAGSEPGALILLGLPVICP